jgi:SAM-dependent methyltransferase
MSDGAAGVTAGLDTSRPSMARVWDFLLGGKDNFRADREQAARLLAVVPGLEPLARESREFTAAAVTWLAGTCGIGQFLDLGCGLPTTPPSVHEAARVARPAARVAYVDSDPMVVVHARALLGGDRGIAVARADVSQPLAVLRCPELARVVDAGQPAGVVMAMLLHFFSRDEAARVCGELAGALAPGSWLVVSVGTGSEEAGAKLAAEYEAAALHRHTPEDIAGFLGGLELVPPGIAPVQDWVPGTDAGAWELPAACVLGAAGRVPGR